MKTSASNASPLAYGISKRNYILTRRNSRTVSGCNSDISCANFTSVAGASFEAGTDTTAGTIQWFLMAMVLYPATMKKAQAELDAVFDADSIPEFSRINDLPYCFALVKEVFRLVSFFLGLSSV